MNIKVHEVVPRVFVLGFEGQYELCMSFVRLQEFYESPGMKGKYFTLEEYMDYWAKEFGHGDFDYPTRWNGFNVPGKVIKAWKDLFYSKGLRSREYELLNALESNLGDHELEDIYIIGIHYDQDAKTVSDTIEHELAHALYSLYPEYKESCDGLIKTASNELVDTATFKLGVMGYDEDVLEDEMQAYFSTGASHIAEQEFVDCFKENFEAFKKEIGKV